MSEREKANQIRMNALYSACVYVRDMKRGENHSHAQGEGVSVHALEEIGGPKGLESTLNYG